MSTAHAEPSATALVKALTAPGRPHILADTQGRIPITVSLPAGADARTLGLLPLAPGIGAARLRPAELEAFSKGHPEMLPLFAPPRRPLLDVSRTWIHLDGFRKTIQSEMAIDADGSGVVVGVVDTGIDVLHPDFRDRDGKTRIAWLLVAAPPRGVHAELEREFGCDDPKQSACAIYDAADINALIAAQSSAVPDREGHGTHVASIAAGNGGLKAFSEPRYAGVAPNATLVIASPTEGGGFYDPDVLNATRFIFDRAQALGRPAVVNLSVGGDYGPHDGTSPIEKGLSALVGDDKPGRVIVTAAGNSGALYELGNNLAGIHTEARVFPHATTRVPILAAPARRKGQGFVWITFRPGDDVEVALEGPGQSSWIGFTGKGEQRGYDNDGNTAGVVNNVVSPTSSITSDTNSAIVVFDGTWPETRDYTILLRGSGEASLWVVGQGDIGGGGALLFARGIKQGTIAVPASAPNLLAVGCTLNRVQWKPLGMAKAIELSGLAGEDSPTPDGACFFSAAGPNPLGIMKPEISAPGGFIIGAMSEAADPRKQSGGLFDAQGCPGKGKVPCFLIDDYHAVAAGTSMSAPQVTGAVALLLQIDPTLTQARTTEILQAGARKPGGSVPYDYQIGPGVLDLEGALAALAQERSADRTPDPAKSWYVLSSGYARPDLSFPVWGTVELRRKDGRIVSGLDGTKLTLSLSNGTIVQPMTKVRHGLFRFAVAANAGTAGQRMDIDVFYDGVSLGKRSLSIGTDAFNADGDFKAKSGACAFVVPGFEGGYAWAIALGALGIVAARRRSRRG